MLSLSLSECIDVVYNCGKKYLDSYFLSCIRNNTNINFLSLVLVFHVLITYVTSVASRWRSKFVLFKHFYYYSNDNIKLSL